MVDVYLSMSKVKNGLSFLMTKMRGWKDKTTEI
jgi:hypothetical protein